MPRGTQVPASSLSGSGTGLSPALAKLSSFFPLPTRESIPPALQPRLDESNRFRLVPLRSPLLRESRLISFPSGTEMFHFPELASCKLCIHLRTTEHDFRRQGIHPMLLSTCLSKKLPSFPMQLLKSQPRRVRQALCLVHIHVLAHACCQTRPDLEYVSCGGAGRD